MPLAFSAAFAAMHAAKIGFALGDSSLHILQGLLLASLAGAAVAETYRTVCWRRPVARMLRRFTDARAGRMPIERFRELAVPWSLRPVVEEMAGVLVDLRGHRSELAELEREMSHRVASRTDALERRIGSLRQIASRDGLTGLMNRRMLDQTLPVLIERCVAEALPLACLMMDLDYFKHLNDTLGHAAGDDFLHDVGQLIRSTIRQDDAAFRCGGDEFTLLMPGADRESAQALAERLISLVEQAARPLRLTLSPGLSVGIALLDELEERSAPALLAAADKSLYERKHARPDRPRRAG